MLESNQKYDVKSIQVEPDSMADVLKMGKGLVRLHSAYNERFKMMNSQMTFVQEIISGQRFGNVSDKIKYDAIAIDKLNKIWSGGLYYEITRNPLKPNRISKYEIVYNTVNLDPQKEHFELPPLEELNPLSHVNDTGLFIEMTEYIPVRLAWWKLSIDQVNSQWYSPRYYSWDHIRQQPLTKTTNYWGKPFFFSLIKQLRTLWNKYYYIISPMDHEIIRETKFALSQDSTSGYAKTL
jgi:hypothetical protein